MTTTPRDAIAETHTVHDPFLKKDVEVSSKLTDRLRGRYASGPTMPNGEPEFGWRQFETPPIQHEAATQLDALHKELAQTQAHLAIRNGDLAEAVRERDSLQERVKELEDDNLRLHSDKMDQFERAITAESSATRAEQERDEALERAAKVAENPPQPLGRGHACIATGRLIAAAILRLAAGPDKEKRE